jgi:hypothetical protein
MYQFMFYLTLQCETEIFEETVIRNDETAT